MLGGVSGIDLTAWLSGTNGEAEAVVERGGRELRFRPGSAATDLRGAAWDFDGDLGALGLTASDARISGESYPDALGRLWAALNTVHAGDILISAAPGWELVDWGGITHCPGGSHGSLEAGDSLGPLLTVGVEPETLRGREQWRISDVADLVLAHFGLDGTPGRREGVQRSAKVAR